MRCDRENVENILCHMKKAIMEDKFILVDRHKNQRTLAMLGLMASDVIDEMMTLSYVNYIDGPVVDRDFPETDKLWIFKKNIDGNTIYIKFKILYQTDGSVKALSFHIDEI